MTDAGPTSRDDVARPARAGAAHTARAETTHAAQAETAHTAQADVAPYRPATAAGAGGDSSQPGLFDLPPGARRTPTRVVLLTGPSGSGKTSLTRRAGLPVVSLDDFYRDGDHPDLPRRYGIVDWDDPRSWDHDGALVALLEIARTGRAEVPLYDIPTNRRTTTTLFDAGGSPIVLAEGIFAAELIADCRDEGILADALCLWRPRAQTFGFRLLRDLGESRKPPLTLLRRGLDLMRHEPQMLAELERRGARKVRGEEAERRIRELASRPR